MKGKGTMIVTIGAMIALLVCVILMQFRTVEETDITTLEAMRETELRAEVASWKTKYEEASKQLIEIQSTITEYEEKITNNQETSELLEKELQEANMRLGKTEVKGAGIVVTLEDNDFAQIEAYDIYKLVNELRLAGAEAISVNDIRITAMSDIKDIAPGNLVVDGKPGIMSPYVVKAIGDQTYLQSSLTLKTFGYMDFVIKGYDKTAKIEEQDEIIIPKTRNELKLEYAEEVKQ